MLRFCSTNFPVCETQTLGFPRNLIQQNGLQSKLRPSCVILGVLRGKTKKRLTECAKFGYNCGNKRDVWIGDRCALKRLRT